MTAINRPLAGLAVNLSVSQSDDTLKHGYPTWQVNRVTLQFVAALFGQLHPVWSIPASILFGALLVGANSMQRVVQVPSAFVTALNGLVVVFVVSSEIWRRQRQKRRTAAVRQDEESSPPTDKETLHQVETTT